MNFGKNIWTKFSPFGWVFLFILKKFLYIALDSDFFFEGGGGGHIVVSGAEV
jgi:hypothetical protein